MNWKVWLEATINTSRRSQNFGKSTDNVRLESIFGQSSEVINVVFHSFSAWYLHDFSLGTTNHKTLSFEKTGYEISFPVNIETAKT